MTDHIDGFIHECTECGKRFLWAGRPDTCCGNASFVKMTIEQAYGLEPRGPVAS